MKCWFRTGWCDELLDVEISNEWRTEALGTVFHIQSRRPGNTNGSGEGEAEPGNGERAQAAKGENAQLGSILRLPGESKLPVQLGCARGGRGAHLLRAQSFPWPNPPIRPLSYYLTQCLPWGLWAHLHLVHTDFRTPSSAGTVGNALRSGFSLGGDGRS